MSSNNFDLDKLLETLDDEVSEEDFSQKLEDSLKITEESNALDKLAKEAQEKADKANEEAMLALSKKEAAELAAKVAKEVHKEAVLKREEKLRAKEEAILATAPLREKYKLEREAKAKAEKEKIKHLDGINLLAGITVGDAVTPPPGGEFEKTLSSQGNLKFHGGRAYTSSRKQIAFGFKDGKWHYLVKVGLKRNVRIECICSPEIDKWLDSL